MKEKIIIAITFAVIGGVTGHYIGHNHQNHMDDEHMKEMMEKEAAE